jgi:hypothetical protein
MKLDGRDLELLRLAGKYRWLPYGKIGELGFTDLADAIITLKKTGFFGIARSKEYMKPTPKGYKALRECGYAYRDSARRAYSGDPALRRRLEVASIALTALRAGIDILQDEVDALRNQPVFFPAFDLRTRDINLMSNANCAGFGHWGNKAYMLQYVSPESNGMYLVNELGILHKLSSVFSPKLSTPTAMIFAGLSYMKIYSQLQGVARSKRHGKRGFLDFPEVYRRTDAPIHLLSCDETGAAQLALMRQPDYAARIARAALGDAWIPHDSEIPYADGNYEGAPLVIAADMDIQRVERVCESAKNFGRAKVYVAGLRSQMDFLKQVLPQDGLVKLQIIEPHILDRAFGKDLSLYSMEA